MGDRRAAGGLRALRKLAEAGDPRLLKIIKRCMWAVAAVLAGLALVAVFYAGMLKQVATTVKDLSLPSVAVLEGAMQERTLGRMELVHPGQRTEELRRVRKQADAALHNMRSEMPEGPLADLLTPGEVKQRSNELNAALAELPKMRQQADNHQASPEELYTYYNRLIDSGSVLFGTQADEAGDRKAGHGGRVATELFMAADRYSRAASVVSMGLATGHLSPAEYREFTEQRAAFRYAIDTLIPRSTPEVQQKYAALTRSREWNDLATVETTVIEHGPWGEGRNDRMPAGLPDPARWSQLTNQVITGEAVDLAVTQSTWAANLGAANADRNFWLALAGFVVVLGVATGIARGTSYNVRLAEERAQHLAEVRQGHQRVSEKNARELSPLITEIIRRLNRFAKDNGTRQELVDWSYGMLRLGTRVRRIAHNEAIAAGGLPVNEYRKPLELEEALHAARAETTGPEQVQVADRIPDVRLRATVAGDLIRSLCEIMENGLRHGQGIPVSVISHRWANGVLVIIEDAGKGMDEDQLAVFNDVLVHPPEFDWHTQHETAQRGLFLVAHFTSPHGIAVDLSRSGMGGVRAVFRLETRHFVPDAIPVDTPPEPQPAQETANPEPARPVTHAAPVLSPHPGEHATARTRIAGELSADGNASPQGPRPAATPATGLPKRKPQTSLNPELRDPAAPQLPQRAGPRSPDQAQANTAAMLRGAHRARKETP